MYLAVCGVLHYVKLDDEICANRIVNHEKLVRSREFLDWLAIQQEGVEKAIANTPVEDYGQGANRR